MKKIPLSKWLIGLIVIVGVSIGLWLLFPILRNLKVFGTKKDLFAIFQALYFVFPVISLVTFSGWWWKNTTNNGPMNTEDFIRRTALVRILSVVLYIVTAILIVVIPTGGSMKKIQTLITPVVISAVVHVIETFVVCGRWLAFY